MVVAALASVVAKIGLVAESAPARSLARLCVHFLSWQNGNGSGSAAQWVLRTAQTPAVPVRLGFSQRRTYHGPLQPSFESQETIAVVVDSCRGSWAVAATSPSRLSRTPEPIVCPPFVYSSLRSPFWLVSGRCLRGRTTCNR